MDLLAEHHLLGTSAVFYIPNFISEDEERYLLRKVSRSRTSFLGALLSQSSDRRFPKAEMEDIEQS